MKDNYRDPALNVIAAGVRAIVAALDILDEEYDDDPDPEEKEEEDPQPELKLVGKEAS